MKAKVSFSDHMLSVDLSVIDSYFWHLLQNHCNNFDQTYFKVSLGEEIYRGFLTIFGLGQESMQMGKLTSKMFKLENFEKYMYHYVQNLVINQSEEKWP
jgi:hypothetical protein